MKWTLKIEYIIDGADILRSSVVGLIERPELTCEADLGLTHDDGKYLIRQVQPEIAHDQVRAVIATTRPCACCGRLCAIKDHRRRRFPLQTALYARNMGEIQPIERPIPAKKQGSPIGLLRWKTLALSHAYFQTTLLR